MLTLLGTGFLPIMGWKFEWVTAHWIAGLVLAALDGLAPNAAASPHVQNATSCQAFAAFLEVLDDDARKAGAVLRLVLAQKSISSQLVDNLNASIHLRTLLTDIFLIDEALKASGG